MQYDGDDVDSLNRSITCETPGLETIEISPDGHVLKLKLVPWGLRAWLHCIPKQVMGPPRQAKKKKPGLNSDN